MIPERPDWHHDAACRGLTGLFFPERGESTAEARRLCLTCPVIAQCREAGKGERYGIWGDTTTYSRDGRPQHAAIVHGSPGGYTAHVRRGEIPCEECRLASMRRKVEYRARRRATSTGRRPQAATLEGMRLTTLETN